MRGPVWFLEDLNEGLMPRTELALGDGCKFCVDVSGCVARWVMERPYPSDCRAACWDSLISLYWVRSLGLHTYHQPISLTDNLVFIHWTNSYSPTPRSINSSHNNAFLPIMERSIPLLLVYSKLGLYKKSTLSFHFLHILRFLLLLNVFIKMLIGFKKVHNANGAISH